jgi:hypothetical protein
MKSIEEIQQMLVTAITKHLDESKVAPRENGYVNDVLGSTSAILAVLLDDLLVERYPEWENNKWMDDSLIIKATRQNEKVGIWGVMIWGVDDTTEQWTDPFYFDMELLPDGSGFKRYTFLFCDLNNPEITVGEYRKDRSYWDIKDRNWKYIINS